MYDCKVIVKDIFANNEIGKYKALNVSQDKTHSAHSRKSADFDVPDYLEKKAANFSPPPPPLISKLFCNMHDKENIDVGGGGGRGGVKN